MRTSRTSGKSYRHRRQAPRYAARRGLQMERLEDRMVLSGASPAAVNDLFETIVDQPITLSAPGILANDTDAEGDALAAGLFSGPAHGTLALREDGSFDYVPNAGFTGFDSFIYFANDGTSDSSLAAVTIHVRQASHKPAAANDLYQTNEDEPLAIGAAEGILANDGDLDGDVITPTIVSQPLNGTLSMAADGSFVYTPHADFSGLDGFSYFVSDGAQTSDVASVTIIVHAVNDQPVAVNDEFTTPEDTPLVVAAPGVLANDSDADGDGLSSILVSPPRFGTVTLAADGSLLYTPDVDFHGVDGFSYIASDGAATSEVAGVTITVSPVNDVPVAAEDGFHAAEDEPLVIAAPGILANDSDADGDSLLLELVSGPASGALELNADGSFTYTPNPDFHGSDSFAYRVSDGATVSAEATVTIDVCPVNDPPSAAADTYFVDEDQTLAVDAAGGVLANDADPDGDALSASLVRGPAHGTLTLHADGSFSYSPEANFSGTDSFVYAAGDGSAAAEATVTITVNAIDDAPLAAVDYYSTGEDVPLVVDAQTGVLANDADPQAGSLIAQVVDGPAHGTLTLHADGSFTYTPEANYHGTDSFTYKAWNGTEETISSAVITVQPLNDRPVAVNDEFAIPAFGEAAEDAPQGNVLANDSDIDGDALAATLVAGPAHGTLILGSDGSFHYTPQAGYSGTDSFRYQLFDGMASSNVATVTLRIEAPPEQVPPPASNERPTAVNDSFTAQAGTTLEVLPERGVLANDIDPEGADLVASLFSGPLFGPLDFRSDGSFRYTPNSGHSGLDAFLYRVSDGALFSALAAVTLHVTPADQPEPAPTPGDEPEPEPVPEPCEVLRLSKSKQLARGAGSAPAHAAAVDHVLARGRWWS